MRILKLTLFLLIALTPVFASNDAEIFKPNAKIGFVNGEDFIETYTFLDGGKKVLIVGYKNLQLWNFETGAEIQKLFDPEKADFSKKDGRLRNSKVGGAFWSKDGDFVFAKGEDFRTLNFWKNTN